jgi:hypothetical protein
MTFSPSTSSMQEHFTTSKEISKISEEEFRVNNFKCEVWVMHV